MVLLSTSSLEAACKAGGSFERDFSISWLRDMAREKDGDWDSDILGNGILVVGVEE